MISYCPQCGKPVADDVTFCPNCGAPIQSQPVRNTQSAQPVAQMPKDYIVWSILSILFCFWPLGIYALILGNDVKNLWNAGRYQEAQDKSASSKKMNVICLIIGIVKWLFLIVFFIIYFAIIAAAVMADM